MIIAAIPAYNEEKTIASVIVLTQKHVDRVIVCDDGSTDMTGKIAEKLGAEVLRHEKKLGKGSALRTLFQRAYQLNPDAVVTLDSDGQHDPEQIPTLVRPIIEGQADMVVGSRFVEGGAATDIPKYRRTGLQVVNWLSGKANGSQVKDTQSGFRAYSLKALDIVSSHEADGYSVETEHLAKAARNRLKIIEVPIDVKYKGLPKTSKKRPELHTLEIIGSILRLVVEERPLIFLGIPGVVFIALGLGCGLIMLNFYAIYRNIPTSWALASIALTVIGIFAVFTAITLYAIIRLTYKTSKQK